MQGFRSSRRALLSLATAFALGGCTSFSPDGGQDAVRRMVQERGGPATPAVAPGALHAHNATLLAKPLSADDAVGIALLNNRQLQASYAELGIAEADLAQAGRIPNPVLSFGHLRGPDGVDIERTLMLPVVSLLLMPATVQVEQQRYAVAQMRAAGDVLRIADDTRRAWYGAVAATQSADYMEQVKEAAEASAELARRMVAAGNWSTLQQAREQAFLGDAIAQLARARQLRTTEREHLIRLLGLTNGSELQLPERLPDLPEAPRDGTDAENKALANRLDILMAQKELASLSASLGLTRSTRFINLLDLGYRRDTAGKGYQIELQIPLFDWGSARVAKAEASYMQAAQKAAGAAIDARSQVRVAYSGYRSAYEVARHYRDEIVPLKKRISDEQLLRYNGMLISVFDLLADAREQVASVNASIEAQRDFWLADAALQAAMTGSAAPNH
ncbi:MAG: TolC family protein [Massilia sp.]